MLFLRRIIATRLAFYLLLILSIIISFNAVVNAADSSLNLTKKERAWIKAHQKVTVANEMDWPPFDYVENSRPAGYSISIAQLIGQKTGLQMKFINGYTWQELLQQFKAGKNRYYACDLCKR